jgi:hypothetical protein
LGCAHWKHSPVADTNSLTVKLLDSSRDIARVSHFDEAEPSTGDNFDGPDYAYAFEQLEQFGVGGAEGDLR